MPSPNRTGTGEAGSVLLWTIGMLLLSLLALSVTVTAVRAVQRQRELQLAVDQAALAAANQLDLTRFRATGELDELGLDQAAAAAAARAELAASRLRPTLSAFVLRPGEVELSAVLRWPLPLGLGLAPSIELRAASTARLVGE